MRRPHKKGHKDMKKFIAGLMALAFVVAFAAAALATETPVVGIKVYGSAADKLGKIGFMDNGNKFRFVTNVGTTENVGEPAYYAWNATNDYTVTYVSANSFEAFAGIWYCDADGGNTISDGENGWIQISGIADAYVSMEGTAIVVGDVLGSSEAGVGTGVTAGRHYLSRKSGRALQTMASTIALSAEVYSVVGCGGQGQNPRAVEAYATDSTSALKKVLLRSNY